MTYRSRKRQHKAYKCSVVRYVQYYSNNVEFNFQQFDFLNFYTICLNPNYKQYASIHLKFNVKVLFDVKTVDKDLINLV